MKCPSVENSMVIHKLQFDIARGYLLNKANSFKMEDDAVKFYHKIGVITEERYKGSYQTK